MKKRQARRVSAFTLIELLVVVAIIGILIAILLPVLASVKENARASACLSNYRQIGLAVQQYAADYDGFTPHNGGSFSGLIADCGPWTRTDRVFLCPDDYDRVKEGRAGSYRMPDLYQGKPLDCTWPDPYLSGRRAQPVNTILAYEAEQDFGAAPIVPTYRHHGGTQVLYFDGHAGWFPQGHDVSNTDD